MTELGDLINSFDDFKLIVKQLVDELQVLNAHLSDIKSALAEISADVADIKEILENIYEDSRELKVKEVNTIIDLVKRLGREEEKEEKVEKEIKKAKRAVKISGNITPNQYKYIYTLINRLSDAEKKSVDEINRELYSKYKKKLTEFSISEASELIDYLKERIKKARKKGG